MNIDPLNQPESGANTPPPVPPEPGQIHKPKPKAEYPTPTAPSFFTPSPGLSKSTLKGDNSPQPPPVVTQPSAAPPRKSNKKLVMALVVLLIFASGVGVGYMLHANVSVESSSDQLVSSEVSSDEIIEQQAQEAEDDVGSWARNNHRKTDINSAHTHLEVYYSDNGYYPPESVYASEATAKAAFPDLNMDDLKDPSGRFINSTDSDYLYSTEDCSSQCDTYRLVTLLEAGEGVYTKDSLN